MKPWPFVLLGAVLLAAGCKSGDTGKVWGTYQEPVEPSELPKPVGAREFKVLWRKDIGEGAEQGYAILKPAYGEDAGAGPDGLYAAGRDGRVFKLNPENGATLWQRDLDADIFSGVGVGESLAVVTLDDGTVVALDAGSGEVRWEAPLGRQISAPPAVGLGRVVARTAGGMVVGLDAENGDVVWSYERSAPGLSIHGDATPVISGDAVFVGLANGRLAVNNVLTGREYWEAEVSAARGSNELERLSDSDAAPLVGAATVYAATYQGNVAALQLQNAQIEWKAGISSRLPMFLGGGRLLVTGDLGELVAMDAASGETLWTREGFRGHGMSQPLVMGERVVVGDAKGNFYSLDLNDGTLLEKRTLTTGAVTALIPGPDQFASLSSSGNVVVATFRPAKK